MSMEEDQGAMSPGGSSSGGACDLLDEEEDNTNPLTSIGITKSNSSGLAQHMHSQSFQSSSTASSSSSIASSMTTVIHHQQQQHLEQLHQKVAQQMQVQLTALQQSQQSQSKLLQKGTSSSATSAQLCSAMTGSKPKFHSFLQQPETGQFLSTSSQQQQKFARQFVRSSSAHNDSVDKPSIKCIRSASQQIEDEGFGVENALQQQHHQQSVQKMSVLISKSAETIEGASASSSSMTTTHLMGTGIRNTLTLSGGLLAPPNRKLTILSPIHAPPGLHDMLKRHGRSPCSPRIMFPGGGGAGGLSGIEADLFG